MPVRSGIPGMVDVARLAGVSHQTVSRVVNGHPGVRPETAERVRAAIASLGYRPNATARALVTRRSGLIGALVVPGPDTDLLVAGIEAAVRAADRTLLVATAAPGDPRAADRLLDRGADGHLAVAPGPALLAALGALADPPPTVVVDGPATPLGPAVGPDHRGAARALTRHLLGLGHRTVHHVAGIPGTHGAAEREAGWRAALAEAGAAAPVPVPGGTGPAAGRAAGRLLAARRTAGEDVTAVLAADDTLALGLLRACADAGLPVPGRVHVAGIGDRPEAAHLVPALTTADTAPRAAGERAVRILLERVEGRDGAPGDVPAAALRPRASTGHW
ncbi:DNA-binding transcriptional regulator, LacI/PurR family [Nocardiopsis flavescens]|uniref:DNA-binding transcriptional regulator, LacI/PurR family n=2 Tax=Nocardiopsis flavescens TaxID=758803 RepID=A0A1M6EHX3_9ACTN|nr:LacI family DNA-binding transcriptional regulator [Nocardiopsis flavescens]SHI85031.1 DNA-binding transcriptional regulator, LacI/PurR family [Nocardiopsis flavescens]